MARFNQSFNRRFNAAFSGAAAGTVVVPQYGPADWYFPTQSAHWTALGLDVPDHQFDCSVASPGSLTPLIGALSLDPNGTPLYQQDINPPSPNTWDPIKRIGLSQGTGQRFGAEAGSGWNVATESVAMLVYYHDLVAPSTTRILMVMSSPASGSAIYIDHTSGNALRLRTTAGSPSFAQAPVSNMMFLIVWNRTATTLNCYTNLELRSGTYDGTAADGRKGVGGALNSGGGASTGGASLIAAWRGANAETKGKATLEALAGAAMPY